MIKLSRRFFYGTIAVLLIIGIISFPKKLETKDKTFNTYTFRGETYTSVDLKSAKKLYKKYKNGVKVIKTKKRSVIVAFDYLYLRYTNYTCMSSKDGEYYYLYNNTSLSKLLNNNKRLKIIKKEKKFITSENKRIIKESGAKKAKSKKTKLKCIENYFINNYKYDDDYKTGERTKWSRYQDSYGSNVYYLYKNKKGICTDFTEAYKQICKLLKIDCKIEFGGTKDPQTKSHAWNVVMINGEVIYKDISLDVKVGKRYWCGIADIDIFMDNHYVMTTY